MPYTVNGEPAELAGPALVDGTAFVPIADLSNMVGGYVDWSHEAKTARIEIGGVVAHVRSGNAICTVNDQPHDLKAEPYLEDGVLWAPVRLLRDGFGLSVSVTGDNVSVSV